MIALAMLCIPLFWSSNDRDNPPTVEVVVFTMCSDDLYMSRTFVSGFMLPLLPLCFSASFSKEEFSAAGKNGSWSVVGGKSIPHKRDLTEHPSSEHNMLGTWSYYVHQKQKAFEQRRGQKTLWLHWSQSVLWPRELSDKFILLARE